MMTGNTNIDGCATVHDLKIHQFADLKSSQGIEILFPDWKAKEERIVFLNAHEDDAIAGSGLLMKYLTEIHNAKVYPLVLTDGRNGFDLENVIRTYPQLASGFQEVQFEEPELTVKKIRENTDIRRKYAQYILTEIPRIRLHEAKTAYKMLGTEEPIYYTDAEGQTIQDLDLYRHHGLSGIRKWLIEKIREIGATRFLTVNPGDNHEDHKYAGKEGRYVARRSKTNLLHLGDGAKIKDNQDGTEGLYYAIMEKIEINGMQAYPRYVVEFSDSDAELKREVIKQFPSQPSLLPEFEKLPRKNWEMFEPFEKTASMIDERYCGTIETIMSYSSRKLK